MGAKWCLVPSSLQSYYSTVEQTGKQPGDAESISAEILQDLAQMIQSNFKKIMGLVIVSVAHG